MTITISRSRDYFRPYQFEGREITGMVFYRDGAEVLRLGGWIERHIRESGHDRDVKSVEVEHPIRKAIKLDLTKGGHFYMGSQTTGGDKGWVFYFDLSLGDFEVGEAFEQDQYSTDEGTIVYLLRPLMGRFDGLLQNIDVFVPLSAKTRRTPFGLKLKALEQHVAARDFRHNPPSIMDFIKNPDMLAMLNEAAALYAAQKAAMLAQPTTINAATTETIQP